MTIPTRFSAQVASAVARVAGDAARAIAAEAPADVFVTWSDGAIRLTGRALFARALTDPSLRDFAAIARTGAGA